MIRDTKSEGKKHGLFPYVAMTGVFGGLLFLVFFANPYAFPFIDLLIKIAITRQAETSSDQAWTAAVRDEMRGDDWTYTVVLRPGTGWLGWLRQEKVFEIESESTRPKVTWTGPRDLRVELPSSLSHRPRVQIGSYRDVHVTYDIVYARDLKR